MPVSDSQGSCVVACPCRLTERGWIAAESKNRLYWVRPTHWRDLSAKEERPNRMFQHFLPRYFKQPSATSATILRASLISNFHFGNLRIALPLGFLIQSLAAWMTACAIGLRLCTDTAEPKSQGLSIF